MSRDASSEVAQISLDVRLRGQHLHGLYFAWTASSDPKCEISRNSLRKRFQSFIYSFPAPFQNSAARGLGAPSRSEYCQLLPSLSISHIQVIIKPQHPSSQWAIIN